jgi:hypothetical protein
MPTEYLIGNDWMEKAKIKIEKIEQEKIEKQKEKEEQERIAKEEYAKNKIIRDLALLKELEEKYKNKEMF